MASLSRNLVCLLLCGFPKHGSSLQQMVDVPTRMMPASPVSNVQNPDVVTADMGIPEDEVDYVGVETYNNVLSGFGDPVNKTTVACFGDSITYGLCGGPRSSYPENLQILLGEEYVVTKYGACGRTITKSGDMPIWAETDLIESAMKSKPDIVIIMFGTNDAKQDDFDPAEYKANYQELINKFKGVESSPKVYLMSPPPIYNALRPRLHNLAHNINDKVIDGLVKEVSKDNGLPAPVDLFTSFTTKCSKFDNGSCFMMSHKQPPTVGYDTIACDNDGDHPTDKGYALIAQVVHETIF